MKRALRIRVPARRPRVSRLRDVFASAWVRKSWCRGFGRKIWRRGRLDSGVVVVVNWWVWWFGEVETGDGIVSVLEGRGGADVLACFSLGGFGGAVGCWLVDVNCGSGMPSFDLRLASRCDVKGTTGYLYAF